MTLSFTAADLKNATLKIGIFHIPPKIVVQNLPSGEKRVTGVMAEILEIIANYIGYKYTYVMYQSGMFGREVTNGTWDGLVGSLINKDIDFEGVCLIPESHRFKFIDFTTSAIFESYLGVVIRKLSAEQNVSLLTYFKPYPANVWLVIVSLWLVICICTTILDYDFTIKIWKPAFLKIFLLEELSEKKFGLKASKMITLWAFFAALILLLSGYNSVLVASVAVKGQGKHFNDIDDVLKYGGYRFGINHNYHYYVHICEMMDPPYGELGELLQTDPDSNILDMDIGFNRALTEQFAYLVNSVDGKYGFQTMCSLEMLPTKYFSSGFYISFPKNSPLREIISQYIHKLRTAGILGIILERGISASRPHCEDTANIVTPIPINQVVLPFKVLGFGIIISFLTLVFETLNSRHREAIELLLTK